MFETIVNTALGDLSGDVKKKLVQELEHVAQQWLSQKVITTLAHDVLKGIDAIVAESVHVLTSDQVHKLAGAYADKIDQEVIELNQVLAAYIPLQVAVEIAKKAYGSDSSQANAARAERAKGIADVKTEFGELFGTILGGHIKI